MTPRERWQALQQHLSAARSALESGDRRTALLSIDAALAIDGEFLAAQTLRERILTADLSVPVVRVAAPAPPPELPMEPPAPYAPEAEPESVPIPNETLATEVAPPELRPGIVSGDGLARFEARARQRRAARRMAAASDAIRRRHLVEARQALDEVRELDPEHPDLTIRENELAAAAVASAHHLRARRWLAAAAVFGGVILGATWLETTPPAPSLTASPIADLGTLAPDTVVETPTVEPVDPVETATPDDLSVTLKVLPVDRAPAVAPVATTARTAAAPVATTARTLPEPVAALGSPEFAVSPVAIPTAPVDPPPAAVPAVAMAVLPPADSIPPPPPVAAGPDDEQLVQRALQRYRTAYETLDARSAHAVWPAVNQSALERAFQGLESQTLSFNDCDVQLRGGGATATCRGSARYIPKVGSRDPRIEPRVWNFTLRRAGADWQIENARVDR